MINYELRFDVDYRYKATGKQNIAFFFSLRFDVEYRYKATSDFQTVKGQSLRFDVEYRYKATFTITDNAHVSCGLM